MESTPLHNKRSHGDVFTPPSDSETVNKRNCCLSPTTDHSDLNSSDFSIGMDSQDSPQTESTTRQFIKQLITALKNSEVLSLIGSAVSESVESTFKKEIAQLDDKNKKLEKEVCNLKIKVKEKDDMIEELAIKLDRSEQYSRRNNVRITGIAESEGEDTDQLVLDLASKIGVALSPDDIDISQRVPRYPRSPQSQTRPIIVMFVSNASKRALLAHRSKLKQTQVGRSSVFINEDLTKTRAMLAKRARVLVKEKRMESTWVTGGVILVKMKDGGLRKVSNPTQLEQVCEETKLKLRIQLSQETEDME